MTLGIWNRAITGDLAAIDRVLHLMRTRARYVPELEVPVKIAPTNPAGTEAWAQPVHEVPDDYGARVAALLAQFGQLHTPAASPTDDGSAEAVADEQVHEAAPN